MSRNKSQVEPEKMTVLVGKKVGLSQTSSNLSQMRSLLVWAVGQKSVWPQSKGYFWLKLQWSRTVEVRMISKFESGRTLLPPFPPRGFNAISENPVSKALESWCNERIKGGAGDFLPRKERGGEGEHTPLLFWWSVTETFFRKALLTN